MGSARTSVTSHRRNIKHTKAEAILLYMSGRSSEQCPSYGMLTPETDIDRLRCVYKKTICSTRVGNNSCGIHK